MKSLDAGWSPRRSAVSSQARASFVFSVKVEARCSFRKPRSTSSANARAATDFGSPIPSASRTA
ncbi:hypothetical protein [Azospirillum sp. TSO22-1]|uniref:hypothetical protein n=1 Tax=Azospirillum sp. TSO22-1 TaxID=716789 RepID=UPI0011B84615|nr:hypothetical protein [Azospirillum sp. TSO22-1]